MMTVHKYQWAPSLATEKSFNMPRHGEVIHCAVQDGIICLWARVDNEQPMVTRTFVMCGTGHPAFGMDHLHVGTVFLEGGSLVLHIFERPPT